MRIFTQQYHRNFLVGQGYGFRLVRWWAWRESRANVRGYGITEKEAIEDLEKNVQPLDNADINPTIRKCFRRELW